MEAQPYWIQVLLNLPHPLQLVWLLWLIGFVFAVRFLLRQKGETKLSSSGEIMSFKEIFAVGCVGGFILLCFIFAYTSYLTLSLADLI